MGSVEGSPKGFTTEEKTFMDKAISRIKSIDFIGKIKNLNEKYDSVPEPWKFTIAMAIGAIVLATKKFMIILIPAIMVARIIRHRKEEKSEVKRDAVRYSG